MAGGTLAASLTGTRVVDLPHDPLLPDAILAFDKDN
jgi:hypothetical protein